MTLPYLTLYTTTYIIRKQGVLPATHGPYNNIYRFDLRTKEEKKSVHEQSKKSIMEVDPKQAVYPELNLVGKVHSSLFGRMMSHSQAKRCDPRN